MWPKRHGVSPKSCSNVSSDPGGIRRHRAASGGPKVWTKVNPNGLWRFIANRARLRYGTVKPRFQIPGPRAVATLSKGDQNPRLLHGIVESLRGVDARRPSRCSARRGYGARAPSTEREPGTASRPPRGPAQHQVSACLPDRLSEAAESAPDCLLRWPHCGLCPALGRRERAVLGDEPPKSRDRLRDPGIGHFGQWDRLAVEYAGWVRIVSCPGKGQSTGGCESRPRKPPEERGSKFSGVG